MTDIDPIKFGEMSANIENIEATTTRIEVAVKEGFGDQKVINKNHDERIRWVKNKQKWLIGLLT